MGVISDGSYGVPMGIIYSFPVTCSRGKWKIVQGKKQTFNADESLFHSAGLEVYDEFSRKRMKASADELVEERSIALQFVGPRSGRSSISRA